MTETWQFGQVIYSLIPTFPFTVFGMQNKLACKELILCFAEACTFPIMAGFKSVGQARDYAALNLYSIQPVDGLSSQYQGEFTKE
jgi:hypothetical protein